MRIGAVARADRTGLGVQSWGFCRAMRPEAILVVDLQHCSGQAPDLSLYADHPDVEVWADRLYPDPSLRPDPTVERFLRKVDVVMLFETPYAWWLVKRAKELGVRVVIQPNAEFNEHFVLPHLPEPDVFALPTPWLRERYEERLPGRDIRVVPVPIDRELLPYRRRTELRTILHTAGTPAMEDRNGTLTLIEAMKHVKTPVECVVRTLKHLDTRGKPRNVHIQGGTRHHWDLYGAGDVFVLPRKFGGLCLPMQEAMATGMPVLMSDLSPQNEVLPPDWLVPAKKVKEVMTRTMIDICEVDHRDLAERIDWLYEHPSVVSECSEWLESWAEAHSWDVLRPLYEDVLRG